MMAGEGDNMTFKLATVNRVLKTKCGKDNI